MWLNTSDSYIEHVPVKGNDLIWPVKCWRGPGSEKVDVLLPTYLFQLICKQFCVDCRALAPNFWDLKNHIFHSKFRPKQSWFRSFNFFNCLLFSLFSNRSRSKDWNLSLILSTTYYYYFWLKRKIPIQRREIKEGRKRIPQSKYKLESTKYLMKHC